MNPVTLPPSPNWYLDNILVCANDGTVAWGARNAIVIANPSPENDKMLNYRFIANAHKDRVTSLAFSPNNINESNKLLLSGGDDNIVKVWNLQDLTILHVNSTLESKHKIVAVDWFKTDSNKVCYVSEEGLLVCWNIKYHNNQIIKLNKVQATCLSCCPHDCNIAAVGTKSGLIYIIDTRNVGNITHKLKSHNTQIVSLSWCPVPTNHLNESGNKDLLLASAGKERSIYIWRAGGDGRCETCISVPNQQLDNSSHKSKSKNNSSDRWISLKWVEPKLLLSSSTWGELISWDLTQMKGKQHSFEIIHTYHGRGMYCIATKPMNVQKEEIDWRTRNEIVVWTIAQDRLVVCCELKEKRNILKYLIPTIGGYVYCMAACPLDTSQIAFGCGDRMLRLWNLSEPHMNCMNVTTIWQKNMGKIRTIAWHPEKENILAFGTEEGRVGLVDTNTTKPPILFKLCFPNTIYTIAWAPVPGKADFEIYACHFGTLVHYHPEKPEKDPKIVISQNCTGFAWKPDYTCFVVGFDDGSIKLYDKNHTQFGKTVRIFNKMIYCLVWHPESTASDKALSSMQNYLAVSGDNKIITVFEVFPNDPENSATNDVDHSGTPFHKTVATLKGHEEKVLTLAWNPFITGQLISGSYDGTVQVWKVETQEILKTFTQHNSTVLSCMWSPVDPDYVISGSVDFTLRIWKLSDQQVKLPEQKVKKSKPKKIKTKTSKAEITFRPDEHMMQDTFFLGKLQDTLIANKNDTNLELLDSGKVKSNKDEYFKLYRKSMQNQEALLSSIRNILKNNMKENVENKDYENKGGSNSKDLKITSLKNKPSIFDDENTCLQIVDAEVENLKEMNSYKQAMELEVWRNQLQNHLDEAIITRRLNDYLVSLTPSLSFETWQNVCYSYAMQLVSEGNYKKAVTYMLMVNKVDEAIGIYMDAKMYNEAYILANCRLEPKNPLLTEILKQWTSHCISRGNFEEAVQHLTKLGDYSAAAKLLSRRVTHLDSLEVATELAVASADNDLVEHLANQTFKQSLLNGKCDLAQSLVDKFPQIGYQELLVKVCTEVFRISKTPLSSTIVCQNLIEGSKFNLLDHFERLYSREQLQEFYTDLNTRDFSINITNEESLWVSVSYQLALAISVGLKEARSKYIINALGMISHFEQTKCQATQQKTLLINMILNLDNKPILDATNLFNDQELESSKSLRAFLCLAILTWFARAEDATESIDYVAETLLKYISDVFDQNAVNYWTMNTKISKIESELSSAMGKNKHFEEGETENNDSIQDLVEKLNQLKVEKKKFTDKRICVPNPAGAYCMALEFGGKLVKSNVADNFNSLISQLWKNLQI